MDEKIKLVAIFGLGGSIFTIIHGLTHLTSFGIIQLDTFIDLFLQFPFILIMFYQIYQSVPGETSIWAVISLNIFSYGYGIHLAGNAIDEYIAGDTQYESILPDDLVDIIFLFDELLGHLVLFAGLFTSFVILINKEIKNPDENHDLESLEKLAIPILGGGFGIVLGVYLIEATFFILPGIVWSIIFLIYTGRRFTLFDSERLYSSMLKWTHLVIPLVAILYFLIFGSLTPPSEIIGF